MYPGMIDTALQTEIRSISREDFPYVDQFIEIAQQGMLQTPNNTAAKLLDVLLSDDFGSTVVIEQLESVS
ncbi:Benzil reductase ((S)-benzoin forming) [compost metagenome]